MFVWYLKRLIQEKKCLFIHGAKTATLLTKAGPWITELKKTRPVRVATIAMVNKDTHPYGLSLYENGG